MTGDQVSKHPYHVTDDHDQIGQLAKEVLEGVRVVAASFGQQVRHQTIAGRSFRLWRDQNLVKSIDDVSDFIYRKESKC